MSTVPRTVLKNLACLLIGLVGAASSLAQEPSSERIISLTVTVTDQHNQFVGGLGKEQLVVTEKNIPQQITSFRRDERPISVAILLDLSGSQSRHRKQMAGWVTRFVAEASADNEYLIVGFNKGPRVLCDWGCPEKALATTLATVSGTEWSGNTALYDACDFSLKQFERSKYPRRATVLLSDGQDNLSKVTYSQLRRALMQSDALFYGVMVAANDSEVGTSLGMEGAATMAELATLSGGRLFLLRERKDLIGGADYFALELKHQYLLSFKPSGIAGQKTHQIKVKVTLAASQPHREKLHLNLRYKQEFAKW